MTLIFFSFFLVVLCVMSLQYKTAGYLRTGKKIVL